MERFGMDEKVVRMQLNWEARARSRVRVGSEVWRRTNGLLQGNALSVVAALMYASMQFDLADVKHPKVKKGTFDDDKSL